MTANITPLRESALVHHAQAEAEIQIYGEHDEKYRNTFVIGWLNSILFALERAIRAGDLNECRSLLTMYGCLSKEEFVARKFREAARHEGVLP